LEKEGRLVLVKSLEEVDEKIELTWRTKDNLPDSTPRKALPQIIGHLEEIVRRSNGG
jgi:hypothetical protein